MRPRQWIKNIVVFAGLIFSGRANDPESVLRALVGFGVFCLLSSGVYIFNDLIDIEADRSHPTKRHRPIASGLVAPQAAWISAVVLVLIAAVGTVLLSLVGSAGTAAFGAMALAYLLIQVAYTLWLKHVVIVDVFCIAAGFVLRATAGAKVIDVFISPWLIVCTMLLALFLALSKRRHELVVLEAASANARGSLDGYSALLIDQMIAVVGAGTVVSYALYTMWPETRAKFGTTNLKYTLIFVLFGIFRYLYLVYQRKEGDRPEQVLLTDVPMVVNILLYGLTAGFIIYRESLF